MKSGIQRCAQASAVLSMATAILLGVVPTVWAQVEVEAPVVAVFGVEDTTHKLDSGFVETLTSYLSVCLAREGQFRVVPQSRIKERLASQRKESYRGCYDEKCQIELGREVAADKSVLTQVLRIGDECIVTSTLYDLSRAISEIAAIEKCTCDKKGLAEAVERAAASLRGEGTGGAEAPESGATTVGSEAKEAPVEKAEEAIASENAAELQKAGMKLLKDGNKELALQYFVRAKAAGGRVAILNKLIAKCSGPDDPVFFSEDFSSVAEGAIPAGWQGGDGMVVREHGRSKVLILSSNGRASDAVVTAPIVFPGDFRLDAYVTIPNTCWGEFHVTVGGVTIGNACCRFLFNKDELHECEIGKNVAMTLEKRGNVFKAYINGKKYFVKRLKEFQVPRGGIRIRLRQDKGGQVVLHRLIGTRL